jgi:hypothetical protein
MLMQVIRMRWVVVLTLVLVNHIWLPCSHATGIPKGTNDGCDKNIPEVPELLLDGPVNAHPDLQMLRKRLEKFTTARVKFPSFCYLQSGAAGRAATEPYTNTKEVYLLGASSRTSPTKYGYLRLTDVRLAEWILSCWNTVQQRLLLSTCYGQVQYDMGCGDMSFITVQRYLKPKVDSKSCARTSSMIAYQ